MAERKTCYASIVVDPSSPFSYSKMEIPLSYQCHNCGITGYKLWREYNTFLDYQTLLCAKCAAEDQEKDVCDIDAQGRHSSDYGHGVRERADQIGWYIPAVPSEENDTFWGYSSVPQAGCEWWYNLPTLPFWILARYAARQIGASLREHRSRSASL